MPVFVDINIIKSASKSDDLTDAQDSRLTITILVLNCTGSSYTKTISCFESQGSCQPLPKSRV